MPDIHFAHYLLQKLSNVALLFKSLKHEEISVFLALSGKTVTKTPFVFIKSAQRIFTVTMPVGSVMLPVIIHHASLHMIPAHCVAITMSH